jgi:epoxyqueuosine reductase
MNLTNLIKTKSTQLGFDIVGISSPSTKIEKLDYYNDWIISGKNGTMKWMEKRIDEREDINQYFPGIKSVISVAINYYTGNSVDIVAKGSNEYKFSSYAWGTDYHIIIRNKLSELLKFIEDDLGVTTKGVICVDTSPILEKQWAKQAGLGWQGKNTLLLNEHFGSWLFLGELLLDIPLEYDKPFVKDLCGNCTACIDSCSVNALTDYQLDASKCISYLTIEYKEEFDDYQKTKLNDWIYGCDTCQQVCPWNNKKNSYSNEKSFQPIKEIQTYSLSDWRAIDQKEFNNIFKLTPVHRLKHKRFERNVVSVQESSNTVD